MWVSLYSNEHEMHPEAHTPDSIYKKTAVVLTDNNNKNRHYPIIETNTFPSTVQNQNSMHCSIQTNQNPYKKKQKQSTSQNQN